MTLNSPFSQNDFDVRFDWGLTGLRNLSGGEDQIDAIIIVDVLCFGTALDIAISRGAVIFPAVHADSSNRERARLVRAELAESDNFINGTYTLSPSSLLTIAAGERLLLPSQNGAALSLTASNAPVFCACLRNARSVARAAQSLGRNLVVIAAGDGGKNGAFRPALEDLWGAGAIIHYLKGTLSPEAQAAACSFESFSRAALHLLRRCATGRELIEQGLGQDVELAAALNDSLSAPLLHDEKFEPFMVARPAAPPSYDEQETTLTAV
ncbi:MAG: 2-phosphosulfolactate phosphatase [Cyanobacteria bacterium REEB67]|nr:2-phosphosulfolactate phosphatase [Cyanobacteria bacterium REEB67]